MAHHVAIRIEDADLGNGRIRHILLACVARHLISLLSPDKCAASVRGEGRCPWDISRVLAGRPGDPSEGWNTFTRIYGVSCFQVQ